MSAINFSIPAPTNGLMIDHRNPPTTHIFNDVAIDGTIHKVVYICGDQMVYQPTPLPSQKNDNDIFYLSSDEDGLEGLDLLPPISSPKKKKGAKAQFQARKDARKLKKEAAVKLIQAVFVGIRTREEAKHAQEKYAAELKKERAARKALRKSPAGKAQKAAQKMADEYNKVQAEAAQARKTLEQYALSLGYTLKGNETNHQLEQVIKKILDDSIITPTVESSEPEPTTVSVWFDVPSKEQKRSNKNVKKTTKKRNNYKTAKKPTETATKAKIDTKPTRVEYTHDLSEFPSMSSASQHQFKRGILRAQ